MGLGRQVVGLKTDWLRFMETYHLGNEYHGQREVHYRLLLVGNRFGGSSNPLLMVH